MSDNQDHPAPEDTLTVLPSEVSTQGGQDVQVTPIRVDLQAIDPVIERTIDLQTASSDSEISGDLQAAGSALNNLLVPASVLQGSAAVGLQIAASFGGLRTFPNTTRLWAEYFRALLEKLPRMNQILAGSKMQYHPSATYSDYLAWIIAGDHRGGPITGAGMHQMALNGLRQLTDEEILSRIVHLDLTVRLFRRSYVSTKAAREKEVAMVEAKLEELEVEKEGYERLKGMYEGEFERFEADRSRFYREMDRFVEDKDRFHRDVTRIGGALDLGTTIEELEINHDRLIEHLKAVLESNLIDSTAQLETVASWELSGGMSQWLQKSKDLLKQSTDLTSSASGNQARLITQENRHKATVSRLEEENENLRLQVEYLTNQEFRNSIIDITDENSS